VKTFSGRKSNDDKSIYIILKTCYGLYVEGKIPVVRHRRRWEDNIKIDLKAIDRVGQCGLD
jgi:hypothetical protein